MQLSSFNFAYYMYTKLSYLTRDLTINMMVLLLFKDPYQGVRIMKDDSITCLTRVFIISLKSRCLTCIVLPGPSCSKSS